MPRDKEVEEAVLGALMLEKDAYTTVCDILKPESFYEPAHQRIYEAIQSLGAAQKPIDMTLQQHSRRSWRPRSHIGAYFTSGLGSPR